MRPRFERSSASRKRGLPFYIRMIQAIVTSHTFQMRMAQQRPN